MPIHARPPEGEALTDGALPTDNQVHCPRCQAAFQPKRKNQNYCSRECQQNATRGSREAYLSPSQRYDNRRNWDLLMWLNATYYSTRPAQRLGLLKDWLDEARAGNAALRRVLARPEFFAPDKEDLERICFRRCWAYPPVPLLADLFCIWLRECRGWEWVNGSAPEPETGEVLLADNPPPAYKVGPVTLQLAELPLSLITSVILSPRASA